MSRLIDADELTELVNWTFARPPFSRKTILHMIDMARRVDAVPVIRCKECKHVIVSATLEHKDESVTSFYMCDYMHRPTDAEGFCYMAERRTDGTEHDPD